MATIDELEELEGSDEPAKADELDEDAEKPELELETLTLLLIEELFEIVLVMTRLLMTIKPLVLVEDIVLVMTIVVIMIGETELELPVVPLLPGELVHAVITAIKNVMRTGKQK